MEIKSDHLSDQYLNRAQIWVLITTLAYFLMNGAQVFETAVIVPLWTAFPPESFQLFKGSNGLDLKTFWITIHSVHELTFILAIIFCRKIRNLKNILLLLFVIHFAVRVWTILYFAPTIMEFQAIANGQAYDYNLTEKAELWKNLNYLRVGVFMAISFALIPVYIKISNLKKID